MNQLQSTSAETFREDVLQSAAPVVVDFAAAWCGPCRAMAPALEKLARDFAGRVRFAKVDIDDDPWLAEQLGISAVPTLLVFQGGRLIDRMVGMVAPAVIKSKLDAIVRQSRQRVEN